MRKLGMNNMQGAIAIMAAALVVAGCTTGSGGTPAGGTAMQPGPPPGMTPAQGAAYCSKLAQLYGEYVANVGGYLGGTGGGGMPPDIDARVAIANCQDGNTAAGIPVLQQKLRDNKVTVPPPSVG